MSNVNPRNLEAGRIKMRKAIHEFFQVGFSNGMIVRPHFVHWNRFKSNELARWFEGRPADPIMAAAREQYAKTKGEDSFD